MDCISWATGAGLLALKSLDKMYKYEEEDGLQELQHKFQIFRLYQDTNFQKSKPANNMPHSTHGYYSSSDAGCTRESTNAAVAGAGAWASVKVST